MILGIDVAKKKIDVALFNDKQFIASGQFNNTPAGFTKLSKWLNHKGVGQVWACMESTGRYGDAAATYLHKQGHQVSMVNPARIKKYGESQLKRNKTDKLDVHGLNRLQRNEVLPTVWIPPGGMSNISWVTP